MQGAWFATPYWGFGGRMSCTNLRVKVNGVAQNDNLECASMYAGPYFSHPFSMRWLVGAKLLGGCEIYKPCRTDFRRLERRAGFSFGTGLSTTYLATQNLGVRFSTDYDVAPPVVRSSRERLHKLTFGIDAMAKQMRALVERLLELARAENEQAARSFAPCDLSQLAESSALLFEAALFERGLTLQTELEPDITVSGDERQLSQLVEIYLDNARKYASGGKIGRAHV